MSRFKGKTALITGAASGIGAATARGFAAEGGNVVIGDVADSTALNEELGNQAVSVELDVTDRESWTEAVASAVRTFGGLNVLVNCAGMANFGPIDQYAHADWDRVIAVNLTGVFNGIRAAAEELKRGAPASIVNISSIQGKVGSAWVPGYVASKFGVTGLSKAAAMDLGRYGIRVNSVHPGFVKTPMTAGANADLSHTALGRGADPDELARMILFIASEESSFSTGSEFVADGGYLAGWLEGDPFVET